MTIEDSQSGLLGVVSADNGEIVFTYPWVIGPYATAGTYYVDNVTTIIETGQSDDARVTVYVTTGGGGGGSGFPDLSFTTYTQGGWGTEPNGENPGTVLHAGFAENFPGGLVVGCAANSILLASAQAVTDFLPQGGTPEVLTMSYFNPIGDISVLAGQLVALTLNIGFDDGYSVGGGLDMLYLDELVFSGMTLNGLDTGPLAGMTVAQFLAVANDILGGCSAAYSPSFVNDVAAAINEWFVDGIADPMWDGLLVAPI